MWTSKRSKQLAISHAQLQTDILERTAQLQSLSQRLLKVRDEERRKLARDLHDSTGQTLAALKITASLLENNCKDNPQMTEILGELKALADQASDEIRTISYLLHPPLLDEVGFACAAEWYIDGFAKRSRVRVNANLARGGERPPKDMEIALFRVLQESLTNAHRHSGTMEIRVSFRQNPGNLILEVKDFGCGIKPERMAPTCAGVGLAGMRERLDEFHGKLEIESDRNGTTLRATVPFVQGVRPAAAEAQISQIVAAQSAPGMPAPARSRNKQRGIDRVGPRLV